MNYKLLVLSVVLLCVGSVFAANKRLRSESLIRSPSKPTSEASNVSELLEVVDDAVCNLTAALKEAEEVRKSCSGRKKCYKKLATAFENLKEAYQECKAELETRNDELASYKDDLEELQEKYALLATDYTELQKRYDALVKVKTSALVLLPVNTSSTAGISTDGNSPKMVSPLELSTNSRPFPSGSSSGNSSKGPRESNASQTTLDSIFAKYRPSQEASK